MSRGIERERALPKERYEIEGYFTEKQWASYLFIIRAVIHSVSKNEKIGKYKVVVVNSNICW